MCFLHQQVLAFTEIVGIGSGRLEVSESQSGIVRRKCCATDRYMREYILLGNPALAAFPGMEPALGQDVERLGTSVQLVVQGHQLDREVVAIRDQRRVRSEHPAAHERPRRSVF